METALNTVAVWCC